MTNEKYVQSAALVRIEQFITELIDKLGNDPDRAYEFLATISKYKFHKTSDNKIISEEIRVPVRARLSKQEEHWESHPVRLLEIRAQNPFVDSYEGTDYLP